MTQRTRRVASEVQAVLAEAVARHEVKDPRVQGAGLVTFTHVEISGDLRHARAFFTVHGAGEVEAERVRAGLENAASYLRGRVGRSLRMKATPSLVFEIDREFEKAERLEGILRGIGGGSNAPSADELDIEGDDGDDNQAK